MADTTASDPSSRSSIMESLTGGPIPAALFSRRSEFLRPAKCIVKVTTWNVAAMDETMHDMPSILADPRRTFHFRRETDGAGRGRGQGEAQETIVEGSEASPGVLGSRERVRISVGAGGGVAGRPSREEKAPQADKDETPYKGGIGETQQTGQQEKIEKDTLSKTETASGQKQGVGELGYIHVVCLQEVTDVTAADSFLRSSDEKVQKVWQDAIQTALPEYKCIAVQQLVGILMFIFVSPDIASQITTPSTTSVGTGLMGYMGNKGAALARIVLGGLPAAGVSPPSLANSSLEEKETSEERGAVLVFVNCHLAAFANAVDRRNWDYAEIPRRAYFHPKDLQVSGGGVVPDAIASYHPNGYPMTESDLVIWAGDLNYRLNISGDEIRKSLHKFLPPETDGSDPPLKLGVSSDEPDVNEGDEHLSAKANRGFQETISYLLESDQLREQQRARKAFPFYHEGQITFLPTYKYDPNTISTFDTSEKMRVPSYCDRILWKDWKVEEVEIERSRARKLADSRDEKRESYLRPSDSSDVLFDLGKETDEDTATPKSEATAIEKEISIQLRQTTEVRMIDEIDISDVPTPLKLLSYTSYQSITSSDHKPVVAEFSLDYLAVDQAKRSQIQIEIVKDLDRHENDHRPVVTIIVEGDPNNEIVDFGAVTWDQTGRRTITIANTGRTPAVCEFVKRPVILSILEEDEDAGFTKISSSDVEDPMAFGEDDTAKDETTEEVCREWISATFNTTGSDEPYTLQPGEAESITLRLALPPTKYGPQPRAAHAGLLRQLNRGKQDLSDVLIMRVANGQDKFVPVKADYKPTFLGYSLTDLLKVPDSAGGIRLNPKCSGDAHWSAPRELFRMTEFLLLTLKSIVMSEGGEGVRWTMLPGWPFTKESWGLTDRDESPDDDAEDLTRISTYARQALKRWVRDALDCDRDWSWDEVDKQGYSEEDKCEVMAECLLDWLDYLKESVVPTSLYFEVVKGVGGKAGADKILDMLPTVAPPVHVNVFVYLTGFISEITTLLSPKHDAAISKTFSPTLSPTAIAKRLSAGGISASSRLTTTELVKRNLLREFSAVIVRKPKKLGGWRSEAVEKREEERRMSFLAAFTEQ